MLRTSLLLQKIRKGNNSVITCDRVTLLAFCTFSDSRLLMYQVSFNSIVHFQRYTPDKRFTAKNKKGSNSINTGNRVMVLAFCNFPHGPLSISVSSFVELPSIILEICSGQKCDRRKDRRTDRRTKRRLSALPSGSITNYYPILCLKISGWVANSVDPDETPRSVASHLGLHCLLRHVCPKTNG